MGAGCDCEGDAVNAPKLAALRDAISARRPAVSRTALPAAAPDARQLTRDAYAAVCRAEHAHAVDDVEGTQHNLAAARAALARVLAEAVS